VTVAVKNDNNTPLVVPPAVRRRAGFKSGEEIEFRASGGVITIVPKLPVADDDYTPAQRRIIDARMAKADEDIKAGRVYGPFATAEEMAASIEENIGKLRAAPSATPLCGILALCLSPPEGGGSQSVCPLLPRCVATSRASALRSRPLPAGQLRKPLSPPFSPIGAE